LILPECPDRDKVHDMLAYMRSQAWIRFEQNGQTRHFPFGKIQHIAINFLGIKLLEKLQANQMLWDKLTSKS
jgi:hypothetical protein